VHHSVSHSHRCRTIADSENSADGDASVGGQGMICQRRGDFRSERKIFVRSMRSPSATPSSNRTSRAGRVLVSTLTTAQLTTLLFSLPIGLGRSDFAPVRFFVVFFFCPSLPEAYGATCKRQPYFNNFVVLTLFASYSSAHFVKDALRASYVLHSSSDEGYC
jgi:hypothetical protein